jgi:hypothetical protein
MLQDDCVLRNENPFAKPLHYMDELTAELNRHILINNIHVTKQTYHSAEDPITWGHASASHHWSQPDSHEKAM